MAHCGALRFDQLGATHFPGAPGKSSTHNQPLTLDPGGSCSWKFLPFLACLTMETTALYKAVKYSEFFISDIKCQNQFCTCKHSISPLEVKPIEGYFSMWVFRAVTPRCHLRLSEYDLWDGDEEPTLSQVLPGNPGTRTLNPCFCKCITWELVRNEYAQDLPRPTESALLNNCTKIGITQNLPS